jgi:hypothetical protein
LKEEKLQGRKKKWSGIANDIKTRKFKDEERKYHDIIIRKRTEERGNKKGNKQKEGGKEKRERGDEGIQDDWR